MNKQQNPSTYFCHITYVNWILLFIHSNAPVLDGVWIWLQWHSQDAKVAGPQHWYRVHVNFLHKVQEYRNAPPRKFNF